MRITLTMIMLLVVSTLFARVSYTDFVNRALDVLPLQVNTFVQDDEGQIWIGTSRGLYSYDGHNARKRLQQGGQIYALMVRDSMMYVGTDEGLLLFNISTGESRTVEALGCHTVRAIVEGHDGRFYLGSADGLFVYSDGILKRVNDNDRRRLAHNTIYSLVLLPDENLLIGTYDGLSLYDSEDGSIHTIETPLCVGKSNRFVNSLLYDSTKVWIGMEGMLMQYDVSRRSVRKTDMAYGNSIKSLARNRERELFIGTDNGLFVVDEDGTQTHIVHNALNSNSLIGNIVWGLYADDYGNMWIGTDGGVSMASSKSWFTSVSDFSGSTAGNTFYSILADDKNRLWLGGANGLLLTDETLSNALWYRPGNTEYQLSHNRVRNIVSDAEGNVWLATDGGVNRYNELTHKFDNFNIEDSTKSYNANWAYEIVDDGRGRLWIATCQGGVMVVSKSKFDSGTKNIVADFVVAMSDGLANNYIEQLVYDGKGAMYALCHRAGVYKIDMHTHIATGIGHKSATVICCAEGGGLWIGESAHVVFTDGGVGEERYALSDGEEVYSMCEVDGVLWVVASDGIWRLFDGRFKKVHSDGHRYVSIYADRQHGRIYAGGVDGLMTADMATLESSELSAKVVHLSAVYVGDSLYGKGADVRLLKHLTLTHKDNRLSFDISDYDYSARDNGGYVYKMIGLDEAWRVMPMSESRIYFSGLVPGEYKLQVGKQMNDGSYRVDIALPIVITPPIYQSTWAYIVYIVIFVMLIVWILFFFHLKQKLRIEHIEKVKTLEQTQLKIDFFTNVSHEFKTPMSMVIGPLSSAVDKIDDVRLKRDVNTALRNARQLNSMINRTLNFARIDNNIDDQILLSDIDLVEFARSIFNMHAETTDNKNVEWSFESTHPYALVSVDAVKLESILNNLLSNASKYTEQGYVKLSIDVSERVAFVVEDSGIGIPKDELPNVFRKFYRSSKTDAREDSTGIGLYLVKQYVELFGGTIDVSSDGERGTRFCISLPKVNTQQELPQPLTECANEDGVKILIVEDNTQIANFIASIFIENYNVRVAHNGQMGLDLSNSFRPDIVIADIMMPVMDGLEMARKMKKNEMTKDTPIVMLTAKNDRQTESESLRRCVDVFMSKPFEPQHLILRVEQLLKARRATESRMRIESMTEAKPIVAISADEKFASKLVEIIDEHLSDSDFNINALADMMATSPKQLYRKVKAITGQTPVEYLSSIRMKKAAMLLGQGSFSVAEVMYMVGFSNHSYFAKCFSAAYGMTPKQYISNSEKNKLSKEQ